ncbi:hypothetical protein JCM19232_1482 [Vibrio ishigakensis]|uniref:Uncharacterized protein n=1 Tax=Vibrio ishigakensis TaxID=1481914 RepID=A0A0B8P938_9VIBR|nr:hypothetical protein JCM19232_1482 [Vibrio ishigakensis]
MFGASFIFTRSTNENAFRGDVQISVIEEFERIDFVVRGELIAKPANIHAELGFSHILDRLGINIGIEKVKRHTDCHHLIGKIALSSSA